MVKIFIFIAITAIFYFSGDDQNQEEKYNEIVKTYNTIPQSEINKIVSKLGESATIEQIVQQYNRK